MSGEDLGCALRRRSHTDCHRLLSLHTCTEYCTLALHTACCTKIFRDSHCTLALSTAHLHWMLHTVLHSACCRLQLALHTACCNLHWILHATHGMSGTVTAFCTLHCIMHWMQRTKLHYITLLLGCLWLPAPKSALLHFHNNSHNIKYIEHCPVFTLFTFGEATAVKILWAAPSSPSFTKFERGLWMRCPLAHLGLKDGSTLELAI